MSTPVVPNKSRYNVLQDNRNEMKNNNEDTMTVGDTNANQITRGVTTSGGELRSKNLTEETRCSNIGKPENSPQLDSERNRFQSSVAVPDIRLSFTPNRELHYRSDGAKDTSRIALMSRGHSLSNLRINTNDAFSVVLSKSDADLIQHVSKEQTPRRIEPEGIKRLSLGRSRKLIAKTESFGKEFVGRVSGKRLLSASLDSIDTSHHLTADAEKSRKTSTDHFLGMVFRPTDSISEGNIVRFSKPTSTSEIKKTHIPATQMSVDNVLYYNKQSTMHPAPLDIHVNVKSNEAQSKSEAQLDHQVDKRGKPELRSPLCSQTKPMCQQKIDRIMLAEFVGCQREENDALEQNEKDYGSDAHKGKLRQEPCSKEDDLHLNEAADSVRLVGSNNHPSLGRGSSHSDGRAANHGNEECIAEKEVDPLLPLAAGSRHRGKLIHAHYKNLSDADSNCIHAVAGHGSYNVNLPDGKHFYNNESKLMVVKGNSESNAGLPSDLLEQPEVFSAESVSDEHYSSIQDHVSVQSKKTVTARKPISSELMESYRVPARTDTLLCAPTPLYPVATVNNNPPAISNGNLKELYALQVDKLSSSAVLPPIDSMSLLSLSPKVPNQTATVVSNSGIPKPILVYSKGSHPIKGDGDSNCIEKHEEILEIKPEIPKPKHVRPKIITYIRRNPQTIGQLDPPFAPPGLSYVPPACSMPAVKEQKTSDENEIKPASVLYDKFKPDLQKPRIYSSGLVMSGIKSSGHHFGHMGEKFLQEVGERPIKEEYCSPPYTHYEVPPSFYRSAMILKPQLGLGAVSRLPSAKSRILIASQRSSGSCIHPQGPITSSPALFHPDASVDLKKGPNANASKSNLPKPCQSGLRPPGYSRLPAAKLAAFGFVRSSSVSSVSSNQSNDSVQSDQSRPSNRSNFGNEEQTAPKAAEPSKEAPKGASRATLQASNSTPVARKSLLPAPKTTTVPTGLKKEVQKDQEANRPTISSPKRLAVSATKLHSPGHPKQRSSVPRNGFSTKPELQTREAGRQFIQQMKEKCDEQARRLSRIQEELKRTSCGFDVFVITTQYFFMKSEHALVKEKELSAELANIKDEVAIQAAKYEKLQKEKEELERRFEGQLKKLGWQQQEELQCLEERLQQQYGTEMTRLQEEHGTRLVRMNSHHQEQVEDITATQKAMVLEMENSHTAAIAALQEEYEQRVQELKLAHELEKKELEENFETLRLSLQDQVDTLTFQSQTLRDKAKRFEEALKKNTEEQLEVALAPYQHLEEDTISLKQVLEMKNQLIHQQEKRIIELEKLAEKNLILEEKIQVLQQQNEDLRVRIDQNTVVTRHLSEENANLQEHVEKETEEKKRLSRTNEELLWKLQTVEPMSPVKLSPTSPTHIYRSSSGPPTPAKVSTVPR